MRTKGAARAGWLASAGVVLALITPKCPLCVAAVLASIGLGGVLAQSVAPWVLTFGHVLTAGALSVALAIVVRRVLAVSTRRRRGQCHCSERA